MIRLGFILFLLSITSSAFGADSVIPKDQVINICAEDTGWVPYSNPIKSEGNNGYEFSGYNRDIIEEIFKKNNIKFKFVIKPWQRCLKDAIDGNIHLVLDAASNEERERNYLLTTPIYRMTPAYFFHKSDDKKLMMKTADLILKNSPICGQSGYTYKNFGIPSKEVKRLSKALGRIIDLVSAKRCKIGLTRLEVLKRVLPTLKEYSDISYSVIKGAEKEEFFWLINKNFSFSKKLKKIIDKEFKSLISNGKLLKISTKYKI
ncbi:transporter substrate-binding domain-containing protein [Halobacteriovorax sp. JY17]|uniref:substrate-binding periplasmic protein n=1 Tax=Halobacteriovorax sp. JY17 TaxID=2014617 RepID=UPI000C528F82|nr:transporter substrate-binding domain-containing protein [Halobacteriovorax sp. JY17]PIK13777.1 MAG: hypothetical protein CES88_12370 [Halobacteriovorax sp. JY17]